jgi:hypothetical protein
MRKHITDSKKLNGSGTEESSVTHWIAGFVSSRDGLDVMANEKMPVSARIET